MSQLTGAKVGTQKVQEDLMRQNRILERKIKALEFALKAERFDCKSERMSDVRAKTTKKEAPEEAADEAGGSPAPSTNSQQVENCSML